MGEVYYVLFLLALRLTKNIRKRNPGYVIGTALSGFLRVAGILFDFFFKKRELRQKPYDIDYWFSYVWSNLALRFLRLKVRHRRTKDHGQRFA